MSRLVDLTGKRFGRLVVLERGEDYVPPTNPFDETVHRRVEWICQCDCGNIKTISGESLKHGRTKSCGCLRREVSRKGLKRKS